MKVFLAGATGFIGSHLTRELAKSGHELRCLCRPTSDTRHLQDLGARLFFGDVTDRDAVVSAMRGCDWAVNLANTYSFWERDPKVYSETNIHGTRNVMESVLESGVSKVVHLSAAWVYGKTCQIPFVEETPKGEVRFSAYARTKYRGEQIAWQLHRDRGLPLVVIYPGEVLGPGLDKPTGQHIMNILHGRVRVTSFEDAKVTYVHVNDVVAAIVQALETANNTGQAYLLGREQLELRQLDALITEISGVKFFKVHIPYPLAFLGVSAMTLFANATRRPPLWGISIDGIRSMKNGLVFDGAKAQLHLGIAYTPVRRALEETIASFGNNGTWSFE